MEGLIVKVIGDEKGWFLVEYDPNYPAQSTEILGEYTTKEEAEEHRPSQ